MSKHFFITILILVVVSNTATAVESSGMAAGYRLIIENGLSKDVIDLHCDMVYMKERVDLGLVHIPVNQSFSTLVKPRVIVPTQTNCNMTWPGHGHANDFYVFDDEPRFVESHCGGFTCTWKATEDGIYFYSDEEKKFINAGTWDK